MSNESRKTSEEKKLLSPAVHIPSATYRFQFHSDFPFPDAEKLVPYLQKLGISDVYTSPVWQARPGSRHCYDVTDQTLINIELGGEDAFRSLARVLHDHGMGLVVDIVPNHMGILDITNRLWWDVMQNGAGSPYADFFDIDWRGPKEELHGRLLIPTLGQQFGVCLEAGEVKVVFTSAGEFLVQYYDKIFPTGPRTWPLILKNALASLRTELPSDNWDLIEFESIITALNNLPKREETELERTAERQREKEVCKRRLRTVVSANSIVRRAIELSVEELNGIEGKSESFNDLEEFLSIQAYRLSFWRVAADEINYRRFFDVNELAAIRIERADTFHHVHGLIFSLIEDGCIRGLRIDHPDGLLNPPQYFHDLQLGCRAALSSDMTDSEELYHHCDETGCAMWVVVEKILAQHERIRPDWAVHGTTGYEFLNLVNSLFVDPQNASPIVRVYSKFTGSSVQFGNLMNHCKKLILDISMTGELVTLANRLDRISERNRLTQDFTFALLKEALAEFISCFPVYRSYIRPDSLQPDEDDAFYINAAVRTAKKRNPATDPTVFDFIGSLVTMENWDQYSEEGKMERIDFILRLQQITGPVMAKGLEDTAFYRDFPLASLNEVGGEPDRFGISIEEFHKRCIEQFEHWPHSMLASSTHDTKRSEDVRARINVLSEIPREWDRAIYRWRRFNQRRKQQVDGIHVPTTHDEYLFYETLVGVWPLRPEDRGGLTERMCNYMVKAVREAKIHTSWINVNTAYENALCDFVNQTLDPKRSAKFLTDLHEFQKTIALRGAGNSLSQTLLKCTTPGVPDFYQGSELWDFSLVDPDNRRPVDFGTRVALLDQMVGTEDQSMLAREVAENWVDGRVKMYLIWKILNYRGQNREIFTSGEYVPLKAKGPKAENVCAFLRYISPEKWILAVVPRLITKAGFTNRLQDRGFWEGTFIESSRPLGSGTGRTLFMQRDYPDHGDRFELGDLLGEFPVAVVTSVEEA